ASAPQTEFAPATPSDMEFIREELERERLDTERLEPEQFITVREDGRIIACGRIKPYEETFELGSVWVAEDRRGRGLGKRITCELAGRFPQAGENTTTVA